MRSTARSAGRVIAAALAVTLLAYPTSASAGTRIVEDTDDTDGRLDLAAASHGHKGDLLVHTLVMEDRWASRILARGTAALMFKAGDRHRKLYLDFRDGRLFGEICTDETAAGGSFTGCSTDVHLSRPDRTTLRVTLAERLVKRGLTGYRWQAVTSLNQGEAGCTRLVCLDELPDETHWVRHRLGDPVRARARRG